MDGATQARLAERIRQLRRQRSTDLAPASYRVPATDFTSTAMLADEVDRVFLHRPLLAGLSGDAREPGDWFAFDACGRSGVVWRLPDGSLRAFVNACRHRGMRLACGSGRSPRLLVCPYHAWSYDHDGRLDSLPGEEGFSDVDRDGVRLTPLRVQEEAGLIFVTLAPESHDTAAVLAGAAAELAPFALASYHRIERREHRFAANWKLTIDSFMEAYHLHFLHRDSLRPFFHGNVSLFDAFGRHSRILGVRRSFDEAGEHDAGLLPHVTILYQLFPNTVLIHQQDHVEVYQAYPDVDDPHACDVHLTLYAPRRPDTDAEHIRWAKNVDIIDRVTTTEDFAACERIQANLRADAVPFLIVGRNEPAVAHFHRGLHEILDPPPAPRSPACT
jgi:phenylpropionate dioxygenase-like ring-hydroxylating dioxygenase large terminal subunit